MPVLLLLMITATQSRVIAEAFKKAREMKPALLVIEDIDLLLANPTEQDQDNMAWISVNTQFLIELHGRNIITLL